MIVLFTDFGLHGPYTGQMKAVLHQMAPGIPTIDLFSDAPVGNPKASAYLLAVYAEWFPAGTVFLCVVDPGVGGTRPSVIVEADGRRAAETLSWDIDWKPERLSASFHGRDLFAPVAAMLARGEPPPGRPRLDETERRRDWPEDLAEIVYIDHFGNAMTGLRAARLPAGARLATGDRVLESATTFSNRPPGTAFWYENSNGLAEIAVNQGRADGEVRSSRISTWLASIRLPGPASSVARRITLSSSRKFPGQSCFLSSASASAATGVDLLRCASQRTEARAPGRSCKRATTRRGRPPATSALPSRFARFLPSTMRANTGRGEKRNQCTGNEHEGRSS